MYLFNIPVLNRKICKISIATMPTGEIGAPARHAFLVLTPKLKWKGNWPDEIFIGLCMSGCKTVSHPSIAAFG